MSARLAELCARMAGLRIDPRRGYLVESRLAPLARREGFTSTEALLAALDLAPDPRLAWVVVEAMMPAPSGFFCGPQLFDWLTREGLPALKPVHSDGPLRLWVADCGTGQEVYSLAMALAETAGLDNQVEIYASDLSERALELAQAGVYSAYEVQRGLSARRLVRHFENRGEAFAVTARLRARIRWRRVNLHDPNIVFGRFDAVFCRSALGRMTPEAAETARARLAEAVAPGGLLVLDPAMAMADARLKLLRADLGVLCDAEAPARRAA
jgi:chemotaxis protein methyltransferase CheR